MSVIKELQKKVRYLEREVAELKREHDRTDFESFWDEMTDEFCPSEDVLRNIREYARDWSVKKRKIQKEIRFAFSADDMVWYLKDGIIQSYIGRTEFDTESGWTVTLTNGEVFKGFDGLFRTKDELIKHYKEILK